MSFIKEARAFYSPGRMQYEVYVSGVGGDGNPMMFGIVPGQSLANGESPYPTFSLDKTLAQQLMDSLWSAGLRPAGGEGTAGQATAMDANLDDLRGNLKWTQSLVDKLVHKT